MEFHFAWALAEMKKLTEAEALIDGFWRRQRLRGKDHLETRHAQFVSYIIKFGSGNRQILLRLGQPPRR